MFRFLKGQQMLAHFKDVTKIFSQEISPHDRQRLTTPLPLTNVGAFT
jgi:hypothetical protein